MFGRAEKAAGDAATARKAAQAAEAKIEDLERDLVRRDKDTQAANRALERKEKSLRDLMTEIEQKVRPSPGPRPCIATLRTRLQARTTIVAWKIHCARAQTQEASREKAKATKADDRAKRAEERVEELSAQLDAIRAQQHEVSVGQAQRECLHCSCRVPQACRV
jgi:DNA repair exonuclease SbcCD ATPase subunit